MIDSLNNWMLESTQNFNIIVGLTALLLLGSIIVLFIFSKKIGQPDERTNAIYLKIISCMFTTQIIMNAIFISLVDRNIEYFRQFFILFQGIVFFIGAIYAIRLYRKEFK
ncbi:6-aminohexanoate hydrolase [Heyndrickxia sp. NPDC080065]|uniref:6-aminohexanoate hydrolase n=1 Tax=Heyndrickxia sp. NPDC080065 TaxID=3390568 RepID=UPI003D07B32E